MEDELYHFGVKGMKWGVRRYQNEDGSLTSLGKKRDKMLSDRKTANKHSTTSNMVKAQYSRREFEDAKTRLKLENQKKKSKHQQDLEKKYIDQGFSKDEAEIKAYNRCISFRDPADAFKKNIDAMASVVPPTTKQGKLWRKAKQELDSGRIGDNTYKAFNTTLVLHTKEQQPINDKFYSAMKKAGYGAIRDVNDKENSGYFAKNPLIVFDTDKINVEGFTKLGNDHIDSMFAKKPGKIAAHTLANQYGPIGAAFATSIGAMKLVKRSNETKFVENYRKRHPESTLSNNEILKMRDRTVYA